MSRVEKESESPIEMKPEQKNNGNQETGHASEEMDPLDAFMQGLDETMKRDDEDAVHGGRNSLTRRPVLREQSK